MSDTEWIQTISGKKFTLVDPSPESIDIFDIAHSLGNQCRYAGHVTRFYSVAEHSVLLSEIVDPGNGNPLVSLAALLHDAEEAYTGDINQPLKSLVPYFKKLADRIRRAIFDKFEIPWRILTADAWTLIKQTENRLILTEREVLLAEPPEKWILDFMDLKRFNKRIIKSWDPRTATEKFIFRFYSLWSPGAYAKK